MGDSSYSFPSLNSATLDDVSDSVLIHLLELLSATSIELFELNLKLLELCLSEIVVSNLKWQLLLLWKGYKKHLR
jgi:hypothetical protein